MRSSSVCIPLKLRGDLTTPNAEETHRAIRDALAGGERLVIDCLEAGEVDVSFLQLLVSAERTAEGEKKSIALSAPPAGELAEALKRCGFAAAEGATALSEIFAPSKRGVA